MQQKRLIAAAATAALAAMCIGCGPQSAASPIPLRPGTTITCAFEGPAPSSIDRVLAELPGFTVEQICPVDMEPYFARSAVADQFFAVTAGRVTQNGLPVLTFMAADLDGSGDSFVSAYLDAWAESVPPRTVATEPQEIGGYQVQRFNVPVGPHGYLYAYGPTVVIAYVADDAAPVTAEDAFTKILANLG